MKQATTDMLRQTAVNLRVVAGDAFGGRLTGAQVADYLYDCAALLMGLVEMERRGVPVQHRCDECEVCKRLGIAGVKTVQALKASNGD